MTSIYTTKTVIHRAKVKPYIELDDGMLDEQLITDLQKKAFNESSLTKDTGWKGYVYSGTKDELIDAGMAIDGWFPRDEGNNHSTLRVVFINDFQEATVINEPRTRTKQNMRCLEIACTGLKFRLTDCFTSSARKEKNDEWRLNYKKEQYQSAKEEADLKLSKLFSSDSEAKLSFLMFADERIRSLPKLLENGACGYKVDAESIAEIESLVQSIMITLKESRLIFDAEERCKIEQKIKAEVVKHDSSFTGFMSNLVSSDSVLDRSER